MRDHCRGLLGSEELDRNQEIYDEKNDDENRQSDWAELLEKFDPEDEFVSVYESRYNIDDDYEKKGELTRKRLIAYHQLEAYSLYLKDKHAELAAYREFLVSVLSNLTPSFCRCTTVARLLPTGRLGSHWCLRRRGDSSRLRRGILM